MNNLVMAELLRLSAFAVEKALQYSSGRLTEEEVKIYIAEVQVGMQVASKRSNSLIAERRKQEAADQ